MLNTDGERLSDRRSNGDDWRTCCKGPSSGLFLFLDRSLLGEVNQSEFDIVRISLLDRLLGFILVLKVLNISLHMLE